MNLTGYALIAALISFMGLGLVAYHYKSAAQQAVVMRDAAIRDRDTAVATNKANEATMAKLKADKDASDKLAADLADEIEVANATTLTMAKSLADLRAKDADVDAYLKLPVPAALRGMYDHTKAAGGR
jgi:hypothetical protein